MNGEHRSAIDVSRGLGPGRLVKLPSYGRGPPAWYGLWTDARGGRHKVKLSTDKRVAEQAFAKLMRERDLDVNGLSHEQGQSRLLSEIVALYLSDLATYRRPRYVKAVTYTLEMIEEDFGHVRVRDVTVPRVLLYRRKRLAAGCSNRTSNADAGSLRACFNWALASGYISLNPIEHLRPLPETEDTQVKKRRALTDEEIGQLLTAAIEDDAERASRFAAERTIASGVLGPAYATRARMVPIPMSPFWKFLIVSGLRYGEAATLRWADLDEDAGIVTIRAEVAKSKRSRMVPVPGYLGEDLRALRQIQAFALGRMPQPGDRVFLSPKQRPLDPHGNPARVVLTRLLKRAGIPFQDDQGRVNVDVHALRRAAGTRLARHGVPLATVSAIMGHSDVRLTAKYYIDLRIADTKKAVEGVPEVGATALAGKTKARGS